jgi:vacuolar-type H+-ATPase subunit E/Vma4
VLSSRTPRSRPRASPQRQRLKPTGSATPKSRRRSFRHSRAAQILNAAKLERRRQIAAAQDAGFERVYAEAGASMAKSRGKKEYETLFRALAQEAADRVTGDVVVQVAPEDAALASKVMSDLGLTAQIDASAAVLGGLTLISAGGRVYRRNTLDSRLAKVRKQVQPEVSEILFA